MADALHVRSVANHLWRGAPPVGSVLTLGAGRDTFKHVGKVSRKGEPLGLYGNRKEPWKRAAKQAEELLRQLNEHAKSP
jgi:hypothetical protein